MTWNTELPEPSRIVEQHTLAAGISTRVHELPDSTRTAAGAASALGTDVGAIASSLVFLADDEPILVMTSGRHRVDPAIIAATLAAAEVRMAPAKLVRTVTGQAIGGVAPVGHPAPLRTLVDEALREYDTVWSAAGTPHTVMPLTFDDLVTLTGGTVARVAAD